MLLFPKEKVKDLHSLCLCQIDSLMFDESIRKLVYKYQLGKGGTKYNKFRVASATKAHHDEYNVLSFHPSTYFLCPFVSLLWEKKDIFFLPSMLLLCE